MTTDEIIEKLRQTLAKSAGGNRKIDAKAVTADSTIGSLGFDSLSILDLIYDIQQDFSVQFEPEELASVDTVGGLAAFLREKGA
jgi:acyl carrier protein